MKGLLELRHRDGELLRARDLNAELSAEAWRWALHLRAVHHTWGVALGYSLEAMDDPPTVAVGPGVGYDCRARLIVNWRRVLVPLPSALDEADLVVAAGCGAEFRWREPGRACDDELVLARGFIKGGRATGLDESVRHWCRARRFRLAAGLSEQKLKQAITVSTAAGGFADTPLYFATLEYDAPFGATVEVTNETATSFELKLRTTAAQWNELKKHDPSARVHWTGVERLPTCDFMKEAG